MLALLVALSLATAPDTTAGKGVSGEVAPEVKAVFADAKRLFAQKRYAEAIVKFQEAYANAAHPVILYNIGKCHERLGDAAMALRSFREYARLAPKAVNDPALKGDIANAERRLKEHGEQQLVVFADPATAKISVDGKPLSPSPAYVELKPGTHLITVTADGYQEEARPFVMVLPRVAELTVNLKPAAAPTPDVPLELGATAGATLTPRTSEARTDLVATQAPAGHKRLGTWVSGGVAVAAAATAAGFGVSALLASKELGDQTAAATRTQQRADALMAQAHDHALVSSVAWGVAGAAVVTAVVLFFVEGAQK